MFYFIEISITTLKPSIELLKLKNNQFGSLIFLSYTILYRVKKFNTYIDSNKVIRLFSTSDTSIHNKRRANTNS